MSAPQCPERILITKQEDIRDDALAPCTQDQGFNQLTIKTDADSLGFTNFTGGFNISVSSSPGLQVLSFPDLEALQNLRVSDVSSLTQVSLPELRANAKTLVYPVTYTFTPSITISNALQFGGLSLPSLTELGDLVIRHVPRRQTTSGGLSDITSANSITSDNVISFPGLKSVGTLRLTGYEDCGYFLPNLSDVGDFTFTNALGSKLETAALAIDGSFTLDTSSYPRAKNESTFDIPPPNLDSVDTNAIDVRNITSIGVNATIHSNANARIDLAGLTTVGGAFSITNNTNCSIDLTKLSQTGALSIIDNVDSAIPRLFNLERADSIHLRGNIDTSSGPNILPSLTFVSGTVTIEPWNTDFNCSRLISQQQQGLINNLHCNGTTSTSTTSSPPSQSSSSSPPRGGGGGLSTAASAGIGVGVSLAVIGGLGIWLFIYFRRRFAALEAHRPPPSPPQSSFSPARGHEDAAGWPLPNDSGGSPRPRRVTGGESIQEANTSLILEKDGPYIQTSQELYVPVLPAEMPVTHVSHEMYVPPAELPAGDPRSRGRKHLAGAPMLTK
ncbi:hypothetical protein F5B22DRAFT_565293 [Xylaria bambusicola]|uniref:uncharacterized protein n=1 Tax=Xylaria bambusicola TaxID=326684 RepID=UPI002008B43A|nr:uncharacterized protein F5B22DRAFT_565293 [Xylaria bambusicola]KAI0521183.1 hypothetical protein F5B22DRAFT_565293 [Xylaria bambusicola]